MDKILEVKNLRVAFRTTNGALKAVRNISFDLERGKTLAIVGESGSGKSVTSKAVIGILAGNSIVEGGEILYDGKDLLRISEDEMHKIRGDKISMIFQDPLSSLNPIVKIGKQITEAMLLKSKTNRTEARKAYKATLAELRKNMLEAEGAGSDARVNELCKQLDEICVQATKLEKAYTDSVNAANELVADMEDLIFLASKKQNCDPVGSIKEYRLRLSKVKNDRLTAAYDVQLTNADELLANAQSEAETAKREEIKLPESAAQSLRNVQSLLQEIVDQEKPDFVEEVSSQKDARFMSDFLESATKGVEYSFRRALDKKKEVLAELPALRTFFEGDFTRGEAQHRCKEISALIRESIDRLEIIKDSAAYAFESSLSDAIDRFFSYQVNNAKEEKRFDKQTKKREALLARGKRVEWKVVPKNVYSVDMLRGNILTVVDRLNERYTAAVATADQVDFQQRAVDIVEYLKRRAGETVHYISNSMAREKAIRLMEEVGIHEPRTRFYQYPFEFSGGMRQRIVIAIALAANPDILICDEPTTALDVTIQAQILELINKLKVERNLSVIFITHDLGVVANMADDIAVMYAGKIVEYGTADDIFYDPRHPYTWALLSSMPDLETTEKLDAIPGTPPNMIYPPVGDAFADRNKYAMKIDFEKQPPMFRISETHSAATWLLHPDAPKVEIPAIITNRIARMKKAGGELNAAE
ncbi:MAG: ATP-binding cassette domain-containing protein [Clostridiales bacterium]|nr:ATP-binding cassette domain-containing protein [Clostridiales bacterium]